MAIISLLNLLLLALISLYNIREKIADRPFTIKRLIPLQKVIIMHLLA